jgi:hypothetical protein
MNAYQMVMDIKKSSFSGTLYVARDDTSTMVEYFGDVNCGNCGALCRSLGGTPWMSIPGMSTAELISIADEELGRYDLPELDFTEDGEECCSGCK